MKEDKSIAVQSTTEPTKREMRPDPDYFDQKEYNNIY